MVLLQPPPPPLNHRHSSDYSTDESTDASRTPVRECKSVRAELVERRHNEAGSRGDSSGDRRHHPAAAGGRFSCGLCGPPIITTEPHYAGHVTSPLRSCLQPFSVEWRLWPSVTADWLAGWPGLFLLFYGRSVWCSLRFPVETGLIYSEPHTSGRLTSWRDRCRASRKTVISE